MAYLRHLLTGTPVMVQLRQQNSGVSGGRVFFWMADLVGKSRNEMEVFIEHNTRVYIYICIIYTKGSTIMEKNGYHHWIFYLSPTNQDPVK